MAVSTTASLAAGGTAYAVQNVVAVPLANATANSSALVQTTARLAGGAMTGGSAGAAASFTAGGTAYLINTSVNGESITFDDWLSSSTENVISGTIAGTATGVAFEAVQIAAGTQAPPGTKSTKIYKSQNGIAKEYLDANGRVIARDISAKDLNAYLQSQEQLVEYNPNSSNEPLIYDGTRTVRFNYTTGNVEQINYWGNQIPPYVPESGQTGYIINQNQPALPANQETQALATVDNQAQLPAVVTDNATGAIVAGNQGMAVIRVADFAFNPVMDETGAVQSAALMPKANVTPAPVNNTAPDTQVQPKSTLELINDVITQDAISELQEYDYELEDVAKVIDTTYSRLQGRNVNVSKQALVNICKNYDWQIETMMTGLSNISDKDAIGHALILSELLDSGMITLEGLYEAANPILESQTFNTAACCDNLGAGKFKDILVKAGLDNRTAMIMDNLAFEVSRYGLSSDDVEDIIRTKMPKAAEFMGKFSPLGDKVEFETIQTSLQNISGRQMTTTATFTTDEGTKIVVTQTLTPDNKEIIQRSETYPDGSTNSWFVDGNGSFITNSHITADEGVALDSQIQIKYDETTKEPVSVVYKKASSEIEGAFEIKEYTLKDYPEDYDVIVHIQDGSIEGGKTLSKVTLNQDGSKTYTETCEINGAVSKRTYTTTDKGYSYTYGITDVDGNTTLSVMKSFETIAPDTTRTTINGNEYIASFDDSTQTVTITSESGTRIIDIKAKTGGDANLWEACKNLPADAIQDIDNFVETWEFCPDVDSEVNITERSLKSGTNPQIIQHELGHCKGGLLNLYNDEALIAIYNEEMAAFNATYTKDGGQAQIAYFSQTGGSASTGLDELIAESNILLSTYGNNNESVCSRTQFLAQNFPKTLSYISSQLTKTSDITQIPLVEQPAAIN